MFLASKSFLIKRWLASSSHLITSWLTSSSHLIKSWLTSSSHLIPSWLTSSSYIWVISPSKRASGPSCCPCICSPQITLHRKLLAISRVMWPVVTNCVNNNSIFHVFVSFLYNTCNSFWRTYLRKAVESKNNLNVTLRHNRLKNSFLTKHWKSKFLQPFVVWFVHLLVWQ